MSRVANGGGTPRALAAASGAKNLAAASRKPTSAESLGPWTLTAARALPCGSRDQSTASREGEGVIRSGGEREEEKEGVFPFSPFSSSSSSSSPISTLPPPPTSFPPPSADGGGGLAERAAALPRGTPGLSSVADSAGRSTLALAPPPNTFGLGETLVRDDGAIACDSRHVVGEAIELVLAPGGRARLAGKLRVMLDPAPPKRDKYDLPVGPEPRPRPLSRGSHVLLLNPGAFVPMDLDALPKPRPRVAEPRLMAWYPRVVEALEVR